MFADRALAFDSRSFRGDLARDPASGQCLRDSTLKTPIILSLFCDQRCTPEELPRGQSERKGWIGDALAALAGDRPGDRWGSKLWLLDRSKKTEATRRLAIQYAEEALAWIVPRFARAVKVDALWSDRAPEGDGWLALTVEVTELSGERPPAFTFPLELVRVA